MNYYGPREILGKETGKGTGRWHYTVMNDRVVWPTGNCGLFLDCPTCKGSGLDPAPSEAPYNELPKCPTCDGKRAVRHDNPCPGHATPEEACEHQKQYYLDHARYDSRISNAQHKCEVCGAWTDRIVTWGAGHMASVTLCDAHANREALASLISVGECASSC